jgi:hypothetical protein
MPRDLLSSSRRDEHSGITQLEHEHEYDTKNGYSYQQKKSQRNVG